MSVTELPASERDLVDAVSGEMLFDYTRTIAQWVRLSGSEEEARAFDYLERLCGEFGLTTTRYRIDSLVSWPGAATLEVVGETPRSFPCITHAFGASTGPEGVIGEVAYTTEPTHEAHAGKIVLSDGLANPGKSVVAERAGVLAQININDAHVHEMIVTPVWGTPTPETARLLPTLVTVSVNAADGAELKRLVEAGGLRVRVTTTVDTAWRQLPILTADLAGQEDRFVLFSGHVDSWHYGAMDNGSANATMLEVARLLAQRRGDLRRGLRLAFWSGHSHGRYSASTWYADHHWPDLHQRCVAHVNVDSTGGSGATVLSEANTMAETVAFAGQAIREVAGQTLDYQRFGRAGDQSFWGVGLPSIFMSLSGQPAAGGAVEEQMARLLGSGGKGRSGGLGWWWHTTEDTLDKIDRANLVRDTTIYLLTCWRLCTLPVLPFDYQATADELLGVLHELHDVVGKGFDLGPLLEEATTLRTLTGEFNRIIAVGRAKQVGQLNDCLMALGRWLTPVNYTLKGEFDHDLALPAPPLPALQPLRDLARLAPDSDEAHYLRTQLVRARNRVWHALHGANATLRSTLQACA